MFFTLAGVFLWAAAAGAASISANCSEYEYVVIGSGPGGGSLAANLARAGHTVLLLEAGGDHGETNLDQVPVLADANSENAEASWQFFVSHFLNDTQARRDDKFTYRLTNGSFYSGLDPPKDAEPLGIFYPRGATVGGSAQVNAMNMAMPPDEDWQLIADLTGDDSWEANKMRTLYEEIEKNLYLPEDSPDHGFDGFVPVIHNNVTFVTSRPTVSDVAKEAIRRLEGTNVSSTDQLTDLLERDMNSADPQRYEKVGAYQIPLHIDEYRRRSAARNYIIDTLNARTANGSARYPLTLSTHSLATRVLFDQGTKGGKPKATGVEYLAGEAMYAGDRRYDASKKGDLRRAYATREVIVAGGAFNTPQILKLSGVGPREELEALDIPVVADLPAVGKYMQDNLESGVSIRANKPWANDPAENCTLDSPSTDPCLAEWEAGEGGPYGRGAAELAIWFRSSKSWNNNADIFFFGGPNAEFRGYWPGYSTAQVPNTTFFWSMCKMQVNNTAGTVKLRSADPRDTPLIDFNFFKENQEHDLQALAEGAQFALDVFESVGGDVTPFEVVEPPPGIEMKQGIKDRAFSHHVCGTCRMGPKDDPEYCVDSEFKVNGVEGLRVVDASIYPRAPGAFPVAPTFTISQKAFHLIQDGLKGQ